MNKKNKQKSVKQKHKKEKIWNENKRMKIWSSKKLKKVLQLLYFAYSVFIAKYNMKFCEKKKENQSAPVVSIVELKCYDDVNVNI